jgi:hypothetical protein
MIFPAFLLAVILITASFFQRSPAPSIRPSRSAVVAVPSRENTAVQMAQSSARSRRLEKEIAPPITEKRSSEGSVPEIPAALPRSADSSKGFILKIKVTQNGTLTAIVDGSGAQQYDLTIGDVIEWKAEKKVTLDLSNAGGVDVELNGKPYKTLGPSGKPAYIELDANGVK